MNRCQNGMKKNPEQALGMGVRSNLRGKTCQLLFSDYNGEGSWSREGLSYPKF